MTRPRSTQTPSGSDLRSSTRSRRFSSLPHAATAVILTAFACAGAPDPEAIAPCPGERRNPPSAESTENGSAPSGNLAGNPEAGQHVFEEHCTRCHSAGVAERSSRLFADYPRLDCKSYLEATSDQDLTAIVSHGGEPFGLNKVMKPFAEVLTPQQIADVVATVRAGAAGH